MTYDFYADKSDKIEILNFIFRETDLQIFDCDSAFGQEINEYKTTDDINLKFDLESGGQFATTFQLWTPRFKGDLNFRKVDLDPKHCNGHTFRYSTDGWGLIQLYFGGLKNNELNRSHIGHQSEKRALTWETNNKEMGRVNKWDWKEVEQTGRKLKYQINKMAVRKINTFGVLIGADKLEGQGIKFR
ncbi:MAG: hypothetical protein KIT51_05000 [Cyclobacteriaceae bacterium]|nr:MAG: hypothetical protein KIT51_04725 [Cyclobacteriaceae bacterium]UYN87621.1 MAG: hypothetical protein KIT51_05000 [Cyclobacteriaceae bacterium]